MKEVILFIIFFLIVYFIYLFFVVLRKKALKKYRGSTEVRFLEGRYHIDFKGANMKSVANTMAFTNAFIISLTVSIVGVVPNVVLKLLVGFVILLPLIFLSYSLIGKYFQKKYGVLDKKERRK